MTMPLKKSNNCDKLLCKSLLNVCFPLSFFFVIFEGYGISAIDDSTNNVRGRPYGEMAILIRKQ